MSRIDEALRRAQSGGSNRDTSQPAAPSSASAFPHEDFDDAAEAAKVQVPVVPEPSLAPMGLREEPAVAPLGPMMDLRDLPSAEKLAVHAPNGTSIEQYRRLAARLLMAQAERGTRIVMIASALPGEGKTLTATNLSLTLSESYKRSVLLIDADLRRPWIHEILQLPNVTGLNDGLRTMDRKLPLIRVTNTLSVLTAGRPDPDPMSVLSSQRIADVLEEAGRRFDFVIIDTPPVAVLSDAHLLAGFVDAAILVIQSGKTPLAPIKTAVESLGREKILGIVLNRADDMLPASAYQYYGESYRPAGTTLAVKE
jgi:protein-tyrosine kinase